MYAELRSAMIVLLEEVDQETRSLVREQSERRHQEQIKTGDQEREELDALCLKMEKFIKMYRTKSLD